MTARLITQVFEQYQRARLNFVQSVVDLASKPGNIECLAMAGSIDLLRPMLSDSVPSIQHQAAIALGRMANHDDKLAQAILRRNMIPELLYNINDQNKFYKRAALFVMRAIAKHSSEMASAIVEVNGLSAMIMCLEDFDYDVKEAAAWALGYISRHNEKLALTVIQSGALPLLVICLQEPKLSLKQISTSVFCDISKHNKELAQMVVDAGVIMYLVKGLVNPDVKLKRQVLSALGSIAKHSESLAEAIVEAEIFPDVLLHMAHPDHCVMRSAAILTREICKHSLELSQMVVNNGGIGALIEVISNLDILSCIPAIMALGYIAGQSDELAFAIIKSKGVGHLVDILKNTHKDHVLSISVWAIGQIGKHSPEHAKVVATSNVLSNILEIYLDSSTSEDLKSKCAITLKQILQKCLQIDALEPLMYAAPTNILKYVLGQYSKILPHDAKARRLFVTSGCLRKVQEIQAPKESVLSEYITVINCCFPEEIVRYYSPGYSKTLIEAVENYQPNCETLLDRRTMDDTSEINDTFIHDEDKIYA